MLKKILIGLAIFIVLFIGALVAIPFLFKDQINNVIKAEINKQLKAKVDYADYDLSLIRSFPNLSFGMNKLTVSGVDEFKGDTLISVSSFRVVLDIMSVIHQEKYKIKQIIVSVPKVYATVNKAGKANWDITRPSAAKTGSSSSSFALEINKYKIENGYIIYDDQKGGTYLSISDLNFEGSGDVTQDLYKLSTQTKIAALTFKSGAVAYLSGAKIDAKNDIDVDQKNSKYTFSKNEIDINDLGLLFDGFLQMNKKDMGMGMAITFKSKKAEFKSILSLIPAIFKKDFDKIKTSGSLALDGEVKGSYDSTTLPGIKLNLKVDNAMFQYPSLPTAVTNINIAAKVDKPQGSADLTVVEVSKLHLNIGSDPIDVTIHVSTPVSDPNIAANINGRMDLASVPKLYPMEGLKQLTGLLVAALNFKGRMSDVNKKNYAAIQASGSLKVTNMVYDSKETPMPVKVSNLGLTFNPQKVTLDNVSAVLGKSDIQANGSLDNFIGYFFNKGNLVGVVNLTSNQFDANEWLTKDNSNATGTTDKTPPKPAAGTTEATHYFDVPKNLDITARSQFGKILYDKLVLSNVKGTIHIADEAINLQDLFANLLGGSATISALYDTKGTKQPKVTFSYDIKNMDIQQTYAAVGMAGKMAPVMKYIQGSFGSDLKGSGALKEDMSVDYNSLIGSGKVQIPSAKIVGLPILQKIAEATKVKALDNLAINNAWTVIKFQNGRVNVDPTDLKFGNGYNMNVQGSNGFDETIAYDVRCDIPTSELNQAAGGLISKIPQIPGVPFKMPEKINVTLKIGGTVSKPTVSIGNVAGVGSGAGGAIKDAVKDAANQAKQQAEDAAKKAADQVKKQAQEAADKAAKDAASKLKDATKGIKLPF